MRNGTAWVVQKVQQFGGQGCWRSGRDGRVHTSPCASAHLVGGRVTDEGVIFNLYARFSQNYRFHVTALSKALRSNSQHSYTWNVTVQR